MSGDKNISVPLSELIDLAIESWRLDQWLTQFASGQSSAAGRFVARRLAAFLGQFELETLDLTGQPYDPGLAIELVGTIHDPTLPPDTILVDQMVAPLCTWQGKVVRHGQAVMRSSTTPISSGEEQ